MIDVGENNDYKALRNIEKLDNEGNYPLILITESQNMRGTDLRAENKGICLVIAKPFETERDLEQGLARVGRFNDSCERLILAGVEKVDRDSDVKMMAKLI